MSEPKAAAEFVHVFSAGPFGRAVARYLAEFRADVFETNLDGAAPELKPDASVNVVAAWRPVPAFCEVLDQASHECQRPFISLIADSTVLRLGPVVVPGQGSCWGCWVRRFRQHDPWPAERAEVLRRYTADASAGPKGYLEPFAMMGAARIAGALEALRSSAGIAGYVWEIDMLTRETKVSTVVGVHDCPRCGLHRPVQTRGFAEMRQELAYLWTADTGSREKKLPL
jgi:bacteriocin biosynthesis cyclodehydratase domain-containing protein